MRLRIALLVLAPAAVAAAVEPVRAGWIMSPRGVAAPVSNGRMALPDVHAVEDAGAFVVVRSGGITLHYLGALQEPPVPSEAPSEFTFRIPRAPSPATGRHPRVPVDVMGAFLNGMPVYNQFESLSYNGANLWHYDAVARRDDGRLTAAGHPREELTHRVAEGLLEQLARGGGRKSPLIGYALDGYPIYGPWAMDANGKLTRMRSSYRLRGITRRHAWADGTELAPEQYGPDVSAADPLGTYAEDYEYVAGSGDLDEFNGRFAVTPEYPAGTYAYFLATDEAGRLAFPYLIGPRYYGAVARESWKGHPAGGAPDTRLRLETDTTRIEAGKPVRFRLTALDDHGEAIREFESVHEKPIHFLIASSDLAEFDHIHPELTPSDAYEVTHTFARAGHYKLWADYSLPGEAQHVDSFEVAVTGPPVTSVNSAPRAKSLDVKLAAQSPLRAGQDIPITFQLSGAVGALEPYLGAWAHVVIISHDLSSFAHAHPLEQAGTLTAAHTHIAPGPPPREVRIVTSFPKAGVYKLWAQLQQSGQVLTFPFTLHVAAGAAPAPAQPIPADAIAIRVTQHGYDPPRLEIPAGQPVKLAFVRDGSPNCGSEVLFPSLGIRKALPMNSTVVVELPAQAAGEIAFSCGMGMFRGMIVSQYRASKKSD
jgi:hypothetical protein